MFRRAVALTVCTVGAAAQVGAQSAPRSPALSHDSSRVSVLERIGSEWDTRRRLAELLGDTSSVHTLLRRARLGSSDAATWRTDGTVFLPQLLVARRAVLPGGDGDGAMWQGRGASALLSVGGFELTDGPFRFVFAPEIAVSQNVAFALNPDPFWVPPVFAPRSPFASPWNVSQWTGIAYTIDTPWRFGDRSFRKGSYGQSGAWVRSSNLEIGLTAEHEWWGPGVRSALVLSDNADGIPRVAIRSRRPLAVPGGALEFSYGIGQLRDSRFFEDDLSEPRVWNGLSVTYAPSRLRGLTLGLARAVYGEQRRTPWASRAFDVLSSVRRDDRVGVTEDRRPRRDQITSVFSRWVLPGDGTELYAEFGRADEPLTLRDFLVEPNHSLGYIIGMQRVMPVRSGNGWWRVQAELTSTEQSPSYRTRPQQSWYSSRVVPRGYTHDGQVIGSGFGPAASAQWIAVDRLWGTQRIGLFAQRHRRNQDAFFSLPWPAGIGYCEFDVTSEAGVRGALPLWRSMATWQAAYHTRLNTFFQKIDGCPGNGGATPRDVRGLVLRMELTPFGGRTRRAPLATATSTAVAASPSPTAPRAMPMGLGVTVGSESDTWLRARQLLADPSSTTQVSIRNWTPRQLEQLGVARDRNGWQRIPAQLGVRYNSGFPWGINDGAVWAGRGATVWGTGGFAWRAGPLRVRLAPTVFVAQNAPFELSPVVAGRSPYSDPVYPKLIDLPQRFGDRAYARLDPGQSEIRLDALGVSGGVTSANEWWGPAAVFPFLFSNNAAGIPRLFLGTSAPTNIGIGRVHLRASWGMLRQSDYFDTSGTIARPRRFGAGVVGVFQPRGLDHLELGAGRYFHARWPDRGVPGRYWWRPFSGILKASLPVPNGALGSDDRSVDGENQLASAFARWRLPRSGAEVYAEFGREDHSWDLRDLLVAPDQQSSVMLGAAKAWRTDGALTVGRVEWMNHQARSIDRFRGGSSIYLHGNGAEQGHTLRGQLLGAPTGPGSAAGAVLSVDRFADGRRRSLLLHRILRRQQLSPLAQPSVALDRPLDVQYALSLEQQPLGGAGFGYGVTWLWNANREFRRDVSSLSVVIRRGL
jgi:hypothetical protein